jgi:hypothetical protein
MTDAIFAGGVRGNLVRTLHSNDNTRVLGLIVFLEQSRVNLSRCLEAEALRRGEFRGHLAEELIGVGFRGCGWQERQGQARESGQG